MHVQCLMDREEGDMFLLLSPYYKYNLPTARSAAPAREPRFLENKLFCVSSHLFVCLCLSCVCLWVHGHRRIYPFDPAALLCPFICTLTSGARRAANPLYVHTHALCDEEKFKG